MLYSGTDPESYITEYTSVYEDFAYKNTYWPLHVPSTNISMVNFDIFSQDARPKPGMGAFVSLVPGISFERKEPQP